MAGGWQQGWGTAAVFLGTNRAMPGAPEGHSPWSQAPWCQSSQGGAWIWSQWSVPCPRHTGFCGWLVWLVLFSGQKAPQQGRRVFLAGSFLADFHLEVTFLWQYSVPGLTDSASCALTRSREGLGNCWLESGITWAVRSKPGWQCPTGWWQLQPHKTPHKGLAAQQE